MQLLWSSKKKLNGKTVLNIACWNNSFSLETEKRGTSIFVICDMLPLKKAGLSQIKNSLNSKMEYFKASIYDLNPTILENFDIVLFFDPLYRLRCPLLANLFKITKDVRYIRGQILGSNLLINNKRYGLKHFSNKLETISISQFFRTDELENDVSSRFVLKFVLNIECLKSWLIFTGFTPELTLTWLNQHPSDCAFKAIKDPKLPEYLKINSYEKYQKDMIHSS